MSKYEQGAKAEFIVAEMLKTDGWYIANASSLDDVAADDGAPLVRGADGAKITPDILAIKDGRTAWVEVKLKTTGPEYIRKNDQYEHFIDAKNWRSYLNIESSSGCEVWLAVVEKPERTLQRQSIGELDVVGWWSETDVKQNDGAKYGEPGVFIRQADFEPTDVPDELAQRVFEQKQLAVNAERDDQILPNGRSEDESAPPEGQFGLSEFSHDSGDGEGET